MKLLNNILVIVALGLAYCQPALAYDFTSSGIAYEVTAGKSQQVAVCANPDAPYSGVVIVPDQVFYDGFNYRVTAIADGAFSHTSVTEVQLPNTVREIGVEAFADANDLSSVTLPLALRDVSDRAFAGTAITAIVIPEGVRTIGIGAFEDCNSLHTVMLPSTIEAIDNYAFAGCHSLEEVFCAAHKVPFADDDAFLGAHRFDVITPSQKAAARYEQDEIWGYYPAYANSDTWIDLELAPDTFEQNWARLPLGNRYAYEVRREGRLVAVTAADNYYIPYEGNAVDYQVIPTNLMSRVDGAQMRLAASETETQSLPAAVEDIEPVNEPNIYAIDGTIYITGDNHGKWTTVFDAYGMLHYHRPSVDNIIPDLARSRVYIVIVGNTVKKIML